MEPSIVSFFNPRDVRSARERTRTLVLVGGMTIGTLLTLFMIPSVYVLMAKTHRVGERQTAEDEEAESDLGQAAPAMAE